MSSNFKIHIEGLDLLKQWLKTSQDASLAMPDVVAAVMKFEAAMELRVHDVFTCSHSLNSVLIGKSSVDMGKTLLRYSLQYKYKPVPLHDFKYSLSLSNSISSAPLRLFNDPLGYVKWTPGEYSTTVTSYVMAGKPQTNLRNMQQTYMDRNGNLRARQNENTWSVLPTKGVHGVRAKTLALFGPSLAAQAEGVYEHDSYIQHAKEKMETEIINAFLRAYK